MDIAFFDNLKYLLKNPDTLETNDENQENRTIYCLNKLASDNIEK